MADSGRKSKDGNRKGLKKIVCRYCGPTKKSINHQSYPSHLKSAHGDESGDRREWGEAKFSFGAASNRPPFGNPEVRAHQDPSASSSVSQENTQESLLNDQNILQQVL